VTQFTFIRPAESGELASDIRELFEDLATSLARDERAYSGECHPALDVLETDAAVEVVMDVSGVPPQAIRVMFRGDVLVIAGEKAPAPTGPHQSYHLVEREFGRLKHEWGALPLRVRRIFRVRLHVDLTILAQLASALQVAVTVRT